jgi:hypothetical protein
MSSTIRVSDEDLNLGGFAIASTSGPLLAPTIPPACLSHDHTGFHPTVNRCLPRHSTDSSQRPVWPAGFS